MGHWELFSGHDLLANLFMDNTVRVTASCMSIWHTLERPFSEPYNIIFLHTLITYGVKIIGESLDSHQDI